MAGGVVAVVDVLLIIALFLFSFVSRVKFFNAIHLLNESPQDNQPSTPKPASTNSCRGRAAGC
jgi:hypothetical protein